MKYQTPGRLKTQSISAADQVGNIFAGRSMVIDPLGVILASTREEESIFVADIDMDRIKRVRDKLLCLNHRRPELYTLSKKKRKIFSVYL